MRSKLLLLLVLLLAVGACASGNRGGRPLPPEQARTTVRVENRSFYDMNVYVIQGTQRARLGTVTGVTTRTFTIPSNMVFGMASLRFQADPVGRQQAPISHEITVRAGDQVTLLIPNR